MNMVPYCFHAETRGGGSLAKTRERRSSSSSSLLLVAVEKNMCVLRGTAGGEWDARDVIRGEGRGRMYLEIFSRRRNMLLCYVICHEVRSGGSNFF